MTGSDTSINAEIVDVICQFESLRKDKTWTGYFV
jgi:hypothetical protein